MKITHKEDGTLTISEITFMNLTDISTALDCAAAEYVDDERMNKLAEEVDTFWRFLNNIRKEEEGV